jgi:two-component system, chemotaxis family, chemotaxis protein CheY
MRSVLVVDDDADIRELLATVLEGHGYDVRTATNGQDALEKLRSKVPRVLVLDLVMPVMDGWQLRRAMLEDQDLARIPVVVITGAVDVVPDGDLRATVLLTKPLRLPQLIDAVELARA